MQIIHKGCFSNIHAIECQKHLVQFKFWEANKTIIKWTTNTGPGCVANVLATILVQDLLFLAARKTAIKL